MNYELFPNIILTQLLDISSLKFTEFNWTYESRLKWHVIVEKCRMSHIQFEDCYRMSINTDDVLVNDNDND